MADICSLCSEPVTPRRPGKRIGKTWRHDTCPEPGQCPRCRQPFGSLHPSKVVNGVRQHVPPCPKPARPTGHAFPPFDSTPKRPTK